MKILLDESTPQKLRLFWAVVRQEIESIHAAIEAARPGSFAFVEIGHARGSGC